ncbi:MAG: hypothetical protein AAF581_05535 [Planctomycetota bacterium]
MTWGWLARWRHWRQARRHIRDLFHEPALLAGTSLKPAHHGRVEVVDVQVDADQVTHIYFTILRHPRPYPFSRQFHAVVQKYCYDVAARQVRHERSLNVSRLKGRDGEPGGGSAGV